MEDLFTLAGFRSRCIKLNLELINSQVVAIYFINIITSASLNVFRFSNSSLKLPPLQYSKNK